jgi:hypothetical protein
LKHPRDPKTHCEEELSHAVIVVKSARFLHSILL